MSADIDKYKFLFEFHRDQFNEEKQRFNRLEDKAVKYLSSLSLAFGAYLLLIRSIYSQIKSPYDWLEIIIIISIALTFFAACSAWSFIFRALKLQTLVKMPTGEDVISAFHKNKKANIYLALAKKYSLAISLLDREYKDKLHFVRKGYGEAVLTGWSFMVSVILIFFHLWR